MKRLTSRALLEHMLNGKLRCDVPALHTLRLTPRAARGSMLQTNVVPMSGGGVRQRAVAHLRAPQPAALVAAPPGPGATRMTLRPTHPTRVWHSLCFAQKPPEPSSHSPATLLSDAHFPGLTTRNLVPHTILIGAVPEATRSKVSPPPLRELRRVAACSKSPRIEPSRATEAFHFRLLLILLMLLRNRTRPPRGIVNGVA